MRRNGHRGGARILLEQGWFCVFPSLPAMLKTFSLSLLFMLAIGLMIAFYASIPT
jgi:hypothetical protein